MFSWFKSKPKEHWRLVKTITESVVAKNGVLTTDAKLYIHLFESDRGNRRCEFVCTESNFNNSRLKERVMALPIYQEKIYRWEMGRYDPIIPRYSDVPEEETAAALRGKIE